MRELHIEIARRRSSDEFWASLPSEPCGFRSAKECGCSLGTCRAQPQPLEILHQPRLRDGIYASIIIGGIAAILAFYSIPRADEVAHRNALENQESSYVPR